MRAWANGFGILAQLGEQLVALISNEPVSTASFEMEDEASLDDVKLDRNIKRTRNARKMPRRRNLWLRGLLLLDFMFNIRWTESVWAVSFLEGRTEENDLF